MIDLVAGYARGYTEDELRPFLKSLMESGYDGKVMLFADGGGSLEARKWGIHPLPISRPKIKVHAARFLCLEEVLLQTECEGVLLVDTRDVIFQKDITNALPSQGLHVFEEDRSMRIGSCPYNSDWVKLGYGEEVLSELAEFPISCVGATCGDYTSVLDYIKWLRCEIERIQPRTSKPQDQAAHNFLIRKCIKEARIWNNEEGEVYTVGYIPRGTVKIEDGRIVNRAGQVPAVVHQWDRHQNLRAFVERVL